MGHGQLVLSRKLHEAIYITVPGREPIVIRLVEIDRGKVRLGIAAEPDIMIDREEIYRLRRSGILPQRQPTGVK